MMQVVIMIEEQNGNNPINVKLSSSTVVPIASSQSNDDLSLSTSEYTDADDMSAPTEYLAEFLSAVMQKDYRKAFKYCKLILDFEPNNATAKDFFPLIEEKLRTLDERSSSDDDNENCNNFEIGSNDNEERATTATTAGSYNRHFDVDICSSDSDAGDDSDSYESDEYSVAAENQSDTDDKGSIASQTSNSNSSLFASNSSLCDSNSSFAHSHHANQFIGPVHQLFGESENTTQSYSNSLLEDNVGCADSSDNDFEADEQFEDVRLLPDMDRTPSLSDLDNGNYRPASFSESESPTTEPPTQRAVPI